jgi:hypothetical protein
VDLKPRDPRLNKALNDSDVRSGDMFQITRMDGEEAEPHHLVPPV